MILDPHSVRPEPVEGLPFFFPIGAKEGQGFDKLSPNGPGHPLEVR
ncbi:MAG TPA: hypothetical protein VGB08_08870 [Allosphingosinicella sp.]|jgi:2-oxoisovalerate dehydrogenase E2 component (dihydrolipoyl transacylase)